MFTIVSAPAEARPLGLTLRRIREMLAAIVEQRRAAGDAALHHLDGLSLFGEADQHLLYDGLHPSPEGYALLGRRFAAAAFGPGGRPSCRLGASRSGTPRPARFDFGRRLGSTSAGEFDAQLVEADRAQAQGTGVPRAQVERRALAGLGVVACGQPLALADLVADGLRRPAEVAVDLAGAGTPRPGRSRDTRTR